jgi:hypothetical protein
LRLRRKSAGLGGALRCRRSPSRHWSSMAGRIRCSRLSTERRRPGRSPLHGCSRSRGPDTESSQRTRRPSPTRSSAIGSERTRCPRPTRHACVSRRARRVVCARRLRVARRSRSRRRGSRRGGWGHSLVGASGRPRGHAPGATFRFWGGHGVLFAVPEADGTAHVCDVEVPVPNPRDIVPAASCELLERRFTEVGDKRFADVWFANNPLVALAQATVKNRQLVNRDPSCHQAAQTCA